MSKTKAQLDSYIFFCYITLKKPISAHFPIVCVLLCRYSAHTLVLVIISYLITVQADINNVHK